MPGLFITATGTDTGKTYVTAGLIGACRRAGIAVDALKPIMTGYAATDAGKSDAGALLEALGRGVTEEAVSRLSPFRFSAPLAPSMAAPREGSQIDLEAVTMACRSAVRDGALTLIEGIGGVMVPLDERRTVLDLIAALALPVLLVSGTQLGALSHCLTAYAVLSQRGIAPSVVVLSESAVSSVAPDETRATLAAFLGTPSVIVLPRNASHADFDGLLACALAAIDVHPSRALGSLA